MEIQARATIQETLDEIAQKYTERTGSEICLALTGVVDRYLRETGGSLLERVAVFAIGGYGRRELCRYSDVDVFILYDPTDRSQIESWLRDFLHPLWDARLEIKYSAHTLDEVKDKMAADLDFATALIESRPLPGNPQLLQQFRRFLAGYFKKGNDRFVNLKLEEDQARRKRYGDTYKLLEPNIKESAGGQRDLHTLEWLAVGKGDRTPGVTTEETIGTFDLLQWLLNEQYITVREYAALKDAYNFILRIRHGIHWLSSKSHVKSDHLDINIRHQLAKSLGYISKKKPDVQAFMQAYFRAAREIDYAHNFLISEQFRQGDGRWWKKKANAVKLRQFPGLIQIQDNLTIDPEQPMLTDPVSLVDIFLYAQKHKLQLTWSVRQQIEQAVHTLPDSAFHQAAIGRKLCDILIAPDAADILRALLYTEILIMVIPEIKKIHRLHIQSMYHYYTVDEHTFRTIENLQQAVFASPHDDHYEFRDVYQSLDDKVPIYLGLLLHDIGKAESRDEHHQLGSSMVEDILTRLGLEDYVEIVQYLIRYHLEMERHAFRRDVNRIATIRSFASLANSQTNVKLLYLLTYADISAVSPELWTEWKATLLHELYMKTSRFLQGLPIQPEGEPVPDWDAAMQREYEEHIDQMGSRYAAQFSRDEIKHHIDLIQELLESGKKEEDVIVLTEEESPFLEITVITGDRPKLLSTICGVLTSQGIDIMDAGIFTRDEGVALDQFRGVPLLEKQSVAQVSQELEKSLYRVLNGEVSVRALVRKAEQRWRWQRKFQGRVEPRMVWNEENRRIVVEVTGRDRLGLLYYLTKLISEAGFFIHSAKIHTEAQTITDVFYLSFAEGKDLEAETKEARLSVLREELLEFLK